MPSGSAVDRKHWRDDRIAEFAAEVVRLRLLEQQVAELTKRVAS
jgi:hypothetical protein